MSVELRRFRTWRPDTEARPGYGVLVRYHANSMLRTWYTATPLVILAVFLLVVFGTAIAAWTDPRYPETLTYWDVPAGVGAFGLVPAGIFALLVGAPLFAEDLRYNAPLFYFSRPLRPGTYFRGKVAFLAGVLLAVGFVPLALLLVLGLLLRVPFQTTAPDASAIATAADAFHALAIALPGLLLCLYWLLAVVLFISVHTRRTWHAAMGTAVLVGAWTLLGSTASVLADNALRHVWGPAGWFETLFVLPLEARYIPRETFQRGGVTMQRPPPADHELLGLAMVVVYAVMLATATAALWATNRRLRRVEALL